MAVKTVTMYYVQCDQDGCARTDAEHGEYVAWTDPDSAVDIVQDADWWVDTGYNVHFCAEHRPICTRCEGPLIMGMTYAECEDCELDFLYQGDAGYVETQKVT